MKNLTVLNSSAAASLAIDAFSMDQLLSSSPQALVTSQFAAHVTQIAAPGTKWNCLVVQALTAPLLSSVVASTVAMQASRLTSLVQRPSDLVNTDLSPTAAYVCLYPSMRENFMGTGSTTSIQGWGPRSRYVSLNYSDATVAVQVVVQNGTCSSAQAQANFIGTSAPCLGTTPPAPSATSALGVQVSSVASDNTVSFLNYQTTGPNAPFGWQLSFAPKPLISSALTTQLKNTTGVFAFVFELPSTSLIGSSWDVAGASTLADLHSDATVGSIFNASVIAAVTNASDFHMTVESNGFLVGTQQVIQANTTWRVVVLLNSSDPALNSTIAPTPTVPPVTPSPPTPVPPTPAPVTASGSSTEGPKSSTAPMSKSGSGPAVASTSESATTAAPGSASTSSTTSTSAASTVTSATSSPTNSPTATSKTGSAASSGVTSSPSTGGTWFNATLSTGTTAEQFLKALMRYVNISTDLPLTSVYVYTTKTTTLADGTTQTSVSWQFTPAYASYDSQVVPLATGSTPVPTDLGVQPGTFNVQGSAPVASPPVPSAGNKKTVMIIAIVVGVIVVGILVVVVVAVSKKGKSSSRTLGEEDGASEQLMNIPTIHDPSAPSEVSGNVV